MSATASRDRFARPVPKKRRSFLRSFLWFAALLVFGFYSCAAGLLFLLRWIAPPATAVQIERRTESWVKSGYYNKQYLFVPMTRISANLQHAVIAAEDTRFYQHHGFDWKEVQIAAAEDMEGKRFRGASTIDQQLIKNLFFGTSRSFIRKAAEASLVPLEEVILGKQRILELYLNVVEWGSGIYGAEAAARYYYHCPASRLTREQSAQLAALLPAPLSRRPSTVTRYSNIILDRMRQMGW